MIRPARAVVVLLCVGACGGKHTPPDAANSIPGVPETQQRPITRSEFPRQWPFTVGAGTLGCLEGAVVFRVRDMTYALNDAAAARGFADADALRLTQHRAPTKPLVRLTQDRRMQIFAASRVCSNVSECRARLRTVHAISDAELQQIEAEGLERSWPPLVPTRVPLDPLIAAGRMLCPDAQGSRGPDARAVHFQ